MGIGRSGSDSFGSVPSSRGLVLDLGVLTKLVSFAKRWIVDETTAAVASLESVPFSMSGVFEERMVI